MEKEEWNKLSLRCTLFVLIELKISRDIYTAMPPAIKYVSYVSHLSSQKETRSSNPKAWAIWNTGPGTCIAWGLSRATLDKGLRSRDQWIQAMPKWSWLGSAQQLVRLSIQHCYCLWMLVVHMWSWAQRWFPYWTAMQLFAADFHSHLT